MGMVPCRKSSITYVWTDTVVELHLNITLEYKVSKSLILVPPNAFHPQCSGTEGVHLSEHIKSPARWSQLEPFWFVSVSCLLFVGG